MHHKKQTGQHQMMSSVLIKFNDHSGRTQSPAGKYSCILFAGKAVWYTPSVQTHSHDKDSMNIRSC